LRHRSAKLPLGGEGSIVKLAFRRAAKSVFFSPPLGGGSEPSFTPKELHRYFCATIAVFVIDAKGLGVNKRFAVCQSRLVFNWWSIVTARYQACGIFRAKFASFCAKIGHSRQFERS